MTDALWEAHRKRCLYCRSPLLFKELFIDHVIPERLKGEPAFDEVRISHVLSLGFDILGYENLAPSCYACNTDKLGSLLPPERTALLLTRVQEKLDEVEKLKRHYEEASGVDKVAVAILTAFERGKSHGKS